MIENFLFALFLSFIAGLSTAIGGLISFVLKKPSKRFISVVMGFSLGVMLFLSFTELLHHAVNTTGAFVAYMFFFLGIIIIFVIDMTVTQNYHFERHLCREVGIDLNEDENLHSGQASIGIELHNHGDQENLHRYRYKQTKEAIDKESKLKLEKTSFIVFVGIFIHNFPEGMATMVGTLENIRLGVFLAFAIASHNIPEGIAVSVPICAATNDKKKAFRWSFYSGMSEPIGALIFGLIIFQFVNDAILSSMLAIVAGIMVYISIDELLPISHSFGKEHLSIIGIVLGMFTMAISLSMFPPV